MASYMYPPPPVKWYADTPASLKTSPSGLAHPQQQRGPRPTLPSGLAVEDRALDHGIFQQAPPFGAGTAGAASNVLLPQARLAPPEDDELCDTSFVRREGYAHSEYGLKGPDVGVADLDKSFFTSAAAQGFSERPAKPPLMPGPAQDVREMTSACPPGDLCVNIDSVLDLLPSDGFGPHHFCATAYYPGEPHEVQRQRKTTSVKANLSTTHRAAENCVFHHQIEMPYNARQQFVKVAIYESDQVADTLIGEATLPLADAKLKATFPWPLLRNGEPRGTITLNVRFPGREGAPEACLTPRSYPTPRLPQQPLSASPRCAGTVTPYGPAPPVGQLGCTRPVGEPHEPVAGCRALQYTAPPTVVGAAPQYMVPPTVIGTPPRTASYGASPFATASPVASVSPYALHSSPVAAYSPGITAALAGPAAGQPHMHMYPGVPSTSFPAYGSYVAPPTTQLAATGSYVAPPTAQFVRSGSYAAPAPTYAAPATTYAAPATTYAAPATTQLSQTLYGGLPQTVCSW